jgi:hypothetical protein
MQFTLTGSALPVHIGALFGIDWNKVHGRGCQPLTDSTKLWNRPWRRYKIPIHRLISNETTDPIASVTSSHQCNRTFCRTNPADLYCRPTDLAVRPLSEPRYPKFHSGDMIRLV